jgi:putative NADPH-quinone reductase
VRADSQYLRSRMPKDVLAMHEKINWADGLAFIAPIYFCSFPAMLKGWIDRVWCYDFAFGLTSDGWHGDVNGRIPLLHHKRALLMTSTIFNEAAYDDGIRDAITRIVDEWGFRYPGIPDVEHVYFYTSRCRSTALDPHGLGAAEPLLRALTIRLSQTWQGTLSAPFAAARMRPSPLHTQHCRESRQAAQVTTVPLPRFGRLARRPLRCVIQAGAAPVAVRRPWGSP